MKRERVVAAVQLSRNAFTLAEILVAIAVLTLIVLSLAQLAAHSAAVSRSGSKHIDNDAEGRGVLDRMAIDFAQMLKRSDVDCYLKGPSSYTGHGQGHAWGKKVQTGQQGSDQIAFFSQLPGYYSGVQSQISLLAYRVNQNTSIGNPAYLMLERMGKGLPWNGATTPNNPSLAYPMVFLPVTIAGAWPAAVKNDSTASSQDSNYEIVGRGVFRFEYYYLLKSGLLTDVPWDIAAGHTSLNGFTDVEAIAVAFAVIDPPSRALINSVSSSSLFDLASDMADFKTAPGRGVGGQKKSGDLESYWKGVLFGDANLGLPGVINTGQTSTGSRVPPAAVSGIRIYNRYLDLRTL